MQLSTAKQQPKNRPMLFIFIETSDRGLQFFSVYKKTHFKLLIEKNILHVCVEELKTFYLLICI